MPGTAHILDVEAGIYAADLSTLRDHADTLNCPLKDVIRHAIRLGLTTTDLDTEVLTKSIADLDSDAGSP